MTLSSTEPSKQPNSTATPIPKTSQILQKALALAFAIAGISDAIGAFATPLPPIVWVVDLGQRCCCSWCWAGNGCCCRDWLWRRSRAWGCFHYGCWWLGRLLSWALLAQVSNGTDEQPFRAVVARWRKGLDNRPDRRDCCDVQRLQASYELQTQVIPGLERNAGNQIRSALRRASSRAVDRFLERSGPAYWFCGSRPAHVGVVATMAAAIPSATTHQISDGCHVCLPSTASSRRKQNSDAPPSRIKTFRDG